MGQLKMKYSISSTTLACASFAMFASLSGCAFNKSTVEERTPNLKYSTTNAIALTVVDNRPFILNGEKDENFEGIVRGGYGIPFDFVKQRDNSKELFAARFVEVVARALTKSGSHVTVTATRKGSSSPEAITALMPNVSDIGLVVNVHNSRVDAGGRWSYFYDYEVAVVDGKGDVLATKKSSGEDVNFQREIYESGVAKGKRYETPAILDIEYRNRVMELLSDGDIARALGGVGAGLATAPSKDGSARLVALKKLLDQGAITQDDYDRKKAEILKSL